MYKVDNDLLSGNILNRFDKSCSKYELTQRNAYVREMNTTQKIINNTKKNIFPNN